MADSVDAAPAKRTWMEAITAYGEPRVAIMLVLGFSSGLPFLLVFGTLSAWLTVAGIARADIGLLSYVGLAYTLKFIWAPLLDHIHLPVLGAALGRRRAWMLIAQVMVALGLAGMAATDPASNLALMAVLAVIVAFASATQDIAVDAWRIEAAPEDRQAAMAAAYQLGYRIAILASGAGALYMADFGSWEIAYGLMALLMGLGIIGTLLAPRTNETQGEVLGEHEVEAAASRLGIGGQAAEAAAWLYRTILAPFIDFFARHGWLALLMLATIAAYRVPDFVMGVMANPFYLDAGFTLIDIANVSKIYGVWMTIVGAVAGGAVAARWGLRPTLFAGAIAGALTNLVFAWLATQGTDILALTVAISAENFAGGFAGTALIAYMSSLTSASFTATQYALFSSLYALPGKLLGGLSGYMVEGWGYYEFFIATALMGLPAIILSFLVLTMKPEARKA
ncbi:MAG: MFS transporter [Alphaproteobacteria bacterium]|nr:MFS transporter [Alphaproteobacteria bacterium]